MTTSSNWKVFIKDVTNGNWIFVNEKLHPHHNLLTIEIWFSTIDNKTSPPMSSFLKYISDFF